MSTLSIGQTAPTFSLTGTDDKSYDLERNGARLTLAVFFKTTCPTCMMTWPYVERVYQNYLGAGLAVWGISQDGREVSAQFASQYGSTFPILVDDDWRISREYDPQFVPTLWLIDRDRKIVDAVVGFDKAGLNRLAQTAAARLGTSATTIALDDDGNPPFKPG